MNGKDCKNEFKIPIITEVMEEKYLELISSVADILQIGSRNMQNYPFLTACAKTGKNYVKKTLWFFSDWLGQNIFYMRAIISLYYVKEVFQPHTHRSTSRFAIDLQVVPAAKEITHLPIVVDPSHAIFGDLGWNNVVGSSSRS